MSNKHLQTKMLIISNNVLSPTKNNGKTLLSFIDGVDKDSIRQLYFHREKPSIEGYSYYQLSDNDVLHGLFSKEKRGRVWSNFQASQGKLLLFLLKKSSLRLYTELQEIFCGKVTGSQKNYYSGWTSLPLTQFFCCR